MPLLAALDMFAVRAGLKRALDEFMISCQRCSGQGEKQGRSDQGQTSQVKSSQVRESDCSL